ncbi:MAG TPA: amidase [Acidimicrobiia bacterium]|jgi:aspartyl-tRNA(Asn)/glutamyl-tRNA(Gln) amidotransferase subunit A
MTDELWQHDAWELAEQVRAGELSARELLELSLARIDRLDPMLNAVWFLDRDRASADAELVDRRVEAGEDPGPFAGIPMGVKELAQVQGWPDTHASVPYAEAVAEFDCAEVARLRGAGAVLVGLTTAPEHGVVSYTASKLHGVTRNAWNLERTPGGSSGGSAAAVAAGLFPACTGSDGGGSIRIPSSYSGLFGMKTTFGLLGVGPEPFNYSMTSVHGPIVRSVRDAARYLDATAGPSLTDPTSLPKPPVPFEDDVVSGEATEQLRGRRAAWSSTLGYAGTDPEVEKVVHDAAMTLVDEAGLELVDIPVEMPKPGVAWGLLSSLNTGAFHLDFEREHLDELDDVHRAGVEMLMNLRPGGLYKAIRRRHELMLASARIWSDIDVLLTPTTPTTAFQAEGTLSGTVAGREVNLMGLSAAFTAPFNMTGQPAASIPVGLVDGMPVALQVVAARHGDELCLGAGALMERVRPWPKFAPLAYE